MTSLVQKIETDIETWAEEAWAVVKPAITELGMTVLSQIEVAGAAYLTTGGNFSEALASVIAQLPADLKAGEALIANVLSAQVVKQQAAATGVAPVTAPPAGTPAPAAS